jgi:hypothetical protein
MNWQTITPEQIINQKGECDCRICKYKGNYGKSWKWCENEKAQIDLDISVIRKRDLNKNGFCEYYEERFNILKIIKNLWRSR